MMESATPSAGVHPGGQAVPVEAGSSPCHILCSIAPEIVPVLREMAEETWPRHTYREERRWGFVGPLRRVRVDLPDRFRILLRRYDPFTVKPDWRVEAGGPVEFFEWDDSGRIVGPYGIRMPVYTVRPVYDHVGSWSGFGVNCRSCQGPGGRLMALDARLDCPLYVRSRNSSDLLESLYSIRGRPRFEEARPGLSPTDPYFDLMQRINRRTYFESRGANQYLGPGWTPETLEQVFSDPEVRAVWLGDESPPAPSPH